MSTFYKCNENGKVFKFLKSMYIGTNDGFTQSNIVLCDSQSIICVKLKYLEDNFTLIPQVSSN